MGRQARKEKLTFNNEGEMFGCMVISFKMTPSTTVWQRLRFSTFLLFMEPFGPFLKMLR